MPRIATLASNARRPNRRAASAWTSFLVVAAALFGCSPTGKTGDDAIKSSSHAIVSGTPRPGLEQTEGYVFVTAPSTGLDPRNCTGPDCDSCPNGPPCDGDPSPSPDAGTDAGTQPTAFGTGTLLTNEWVLTAAHVVEGAARAEDVFITIDDVNYAAADVRIHPLYTQSQRTVPRLAPPKDKIIDPKTGAFGPKTTATYRNNVDVALIKLSRPVSNGTTYKRPISPALTTSLVGEDVECFGYGYTLHGGAPSDELRSGVFKVTKAGEFSTNFVVGMNVQNQIPHSGDSGGACVVGGAIVGTVKGHYPPLCPSGSDTECPKIPGTSDFATCRADKRCQYHDESFIQAAESFRNFVRTILNLGTDGSVFGAASKDHISAIVDQTTGTYKILVEYTQLGTPQRFEIPTPVLAPDRDAFVQIEVNDLDRDLLLDLQFLFQARDPATNERVSLAFFLPGAAIANPTDPDSWQTSIFNLFTDDAALFSATPATAVYSIIRDDNKDGKVDLLFVNDSGSVDVFYGLNNNRSPNQAFSQTRALELSLDATGDGTPDRVLIEKNGNALGWRSFTDMGNYANPTTVKFVEPVVALPINVDGDANMDIVVLSDNKVFLLKATGDGGFSGQTPVDNVSKPSDLIVRDFNDDGREDVLVRYANGALQRIFLGQTTGLSTKIVANPTPSDIVFVLDRSGSMSARDFRPGDQTRRLQVAGAGARLLAATLGQDEAHRVALVSYNHASPAPTLLPLSDLGDGGAFGNAVSEYLDQGPQGGTSIGSGMLKAYEILEDGRGTAPTENRREAIFLLTDGMQNRAPCIGVDDGAGDVDTGSFCNPGTETVVRREDHPDTVVCSVGMGRSAASVDGVVLEKFSTRYLDAVTSNISDQTSLASFSKCAVQFKTNQGIAIDPSGVLAKDDVAATPVTYDSAGDTKLTFVSSWLASATNPGDMRLLVNRPNGDLLVAGNPVDQVLDRNFHVQHRASPEAGRWRFQVVRDQTRAVNGFTTDSFVDPAEGTALVRRQIQRLCPGGCRKVLYFEDGRALPTARSAYADALAAEGPGGTGLLANVVSFNAATAAEFSSALNGEDYDLIVYAHQMSEGFAPYDYNLATVLCRDMVRAIITDTRTGTEPLAFHVCSGALPSKDVINYRKIKPNGDTLLDRSIALVNRGYDVFSYSVAAITSNALERTFGAAQLEGTHDRHFTRSGDSTFQDFGAVVSFSADTGYFGMAGPVENWPRSHKAQRWSSEVHFRGYAPIRAETIPTSPGQGLTLAVAAKDFLPVNGFSSSRVWAEVDHPTLDLAAALGQTGCISDESQDGDTDSGNPGLRADQIPVATNVYDLNDRGLSGDAVAGDYTWSVHVPALGAVRGSYAIRYFAELTYVEDGVTRTLRREAAATQYIGTPVAIGSGVCADLCGPEVDATLPSLTAPADVTLAGCGQPDIGQATASDNCGEVDVGNDAPDVFPVGTTVVTWYAQDVAGNIETRVQNVTVERGCYKDLILARKPVGYWRLDDAPGPVAFDDGVGANNGKYTGRYATSPPPSPVPGAIVSEASGGAFFTVTNNPRPPAGFPPTQWNWVEIPHADNQVPENLTLECWFTLPNTPPTYSELIGKQTANAMDGYGLYFFAGKLYFYVNHLNLRVGVPILPSLDYRHVVATYDQQFMVLYIDGAEVGRVPRSGPILVGDAPLRIGTGWTMSFCGALDEVALYREALPRDVVLNHYQRGRGLN